MEDRDPVSGNEIPAGATAEEVRDDVPAMLSENEYVLPADVVRFIGVEKIEKMVQKAKAGLEEMAANGRIGGEPTEDAVAEAMEPVEMAEGGLVPGASEQMSTFNPQMYGMGFMPFGQGMVGSGGFPAAGGMYGPYTPRPPQAGETPAPAPAPVPMEAASARMEEDRDGNRSYEQDGGPKTDPNAWMDKYDYENTTPEGLVETTMEKLQGGMFGNLDKYGEMADDFGLKGVSKVMENPLGAIGALTGNPALGALGQVASKGLALRNIAEANANAEILESQGYTEMANQIRSQIKDYSKQKGVTKAADIIASGKRLSESIQTRYGSDNIFGGKLGGGQEAVRSSSGRSPASGGGTAQSTRTGGLASPVTTTSSRLSFGNSNRDGDRSYEQDRGFGAGVSKGSSSSLGGSVGGNGDGFSKGVPAGSSSSLSGAGSYGGNSGGLSMGSTNTNTNTSVSTSAGDLDMGTPAGPDPKDTPDMAEFNKGGLVSRPKSKKSKNFTKANYGKKRGLGRK